MKQLTHVAAIMILGVALCQCSSFEEPLPPAPKPVDVAYHAVQSDSFDTLTVEGAHVVLKTGKKPGIKALDGTVLAGGHHNVTVDEALFRGKYYYDAVVTNTLLRHITMDGDSTLKGEDLKLSGLTLSLQDKARLELRGTLGLRELSVMGESKAVVYWVNSKELTIKASGGHVELAGEVGDLRVIAEGDAHLDLADLRAERVWVIAKDQASVSVNPQKLFYGNAKNTSKISSRTYLPKAFTRVVADNANILISE